MSAEERPVAPEREEAPSTAVRRRRFSLIWLIPIVAAVTGAWLVYSTLTSRGPSIDIVFETASGLEPGKTPIKYRDVQLGVVEAVTLSDDLQTVIVTARMQKTAEKELTEGTQFWIESARITAGGVSGLGTLLSGAYIGMRPGPGKPTRRFTALTTPPVFQVNLPGKHFVLRAQQLGSVSAGAPILFRGIEVGGVLGHQMESDGSSVSIFTFIRAPYDKLVRKRSHFWNASGIDASVSAAGVNIRTQSLQSILIGGIAFDTPQVAVNDPAADEDSEFPLYPYFAAIEEAKYTVRIPFHLYFEGSVAGLTPGAPVMALGLQLGEVTDVRLETDPKTFVVRIPVKIELQPQRWVLNTQMPESLDRVYARMAEWVEHGLRARLESGNLLTGQKIVSLGMFPNAPATSMSYEDGVAVLPTVPSEIEVLTEKANAFLEKLDKAPVAELIADLRSTVQHADRLIASASVRRGVDEVGPLLDSLKHTSDAARATLETAQATLTSTDAVIGPESAVRYDLARLLKELTSTARSLRTLADFLENNPNALLLGKPTP